MEFIKRNKLVIACCLAFIALIAVVHWFDTRNANKKKGPVIALDADEKELKILDDAFTTN